MPFEISEEFIHYHMDQNEQLLDENISKAYKQISDLTAQIEALTRKIVDITDKKNKNSLSAKQ